MRRALVTGASRGIGREVARMLLADGWEVVGVARTLPTLPGLRAYTLDVGLPHQVERLSWLVDRPLDALIHCAAVRGPHGQMIENDPRAWMDTIRVNLLGAYHVTRVCLPALHESEDGRILLFSGGGAFSPSPGYSAYATAKAGVVSLMETLAAELTSTRVTANCVAPGYVPTSIHEQPVDDGGEAMGTALACIRHLLSPQTRGLTGKTVSAQYDDWRSIAPWNVERLNESSDGTRYRNPIQMLQRSALAV